MSSSTLSTPPPSPPEAVDLASAATLPPGASPVLTAASDTLVGAPASLPAPVDPAEAPLDEGGFAERYAVRALLGEGGMGAVHVCRDRRIGREVAMKVVRGEVGSAGDARSRFLREARVQGQLEHPSIVPVYDLGRDPDGAAYFTMKRVRGLTLEEILDGLRDGAKEVIERYTPRRLLTAFSSVCLAVEFAHARGVLHRDLKPANVMLGDFGEVYLLDWGLARLRGPSAEGAMINGDGDGGGDGAGAEGGEATAVASAGGAAATQAGEVMGTPGYMSPEQARGAHAELDPRADVYSLGAILFELLTLEPLHRGTTVAALVASTLTGAEARPSRRAPQHEAEHEVPPELEELCVRATALRPEDRPASARAVHEEIERFLEGDRDLALRRELSARHAAEAAAAAERALAAEEAEAGLAERRRALRDVSRALALDPGSAPAMRTLTRLLVEPPARVPAEAEEELSRSTAHQLRVAARSGGIIYLSWLLYLPFFFWMGLRDGWMSVLTTAPMLAAAAVALIVARRPRPGIGVQFVLFILSSVGIGFASRAFGPFVLVPALAAVNTLGYMLTPHRPHRVAFLTLGCLAAAAPAALEWMGLIEPSYLFEGGRMVVVPHTNWFPPLPTLAFLSVFSVTVVLTPSLFIGRMRAALADAERRLQLYAWHLRQLVPEEALGGLEAPTVRPPRVFRVTKRC